MKESEAWRILAEEHDAMCKCGHTRSEHQPLPPYECNHIADERDAICACLMFSEQCKDKERAK